MMYQKLILPIFISAHALSQSNTSTTRHIEFGFSHGTYTSLCFQKSTTPSVSTQREAPQLISCSSPSISQSKYGFTIGYFMWVPITNMLGIKPQFETAFSNACIMGRSKFYATSVDIGISGPAAIALKPADANGIIYVARNMSCYLTSKQPYLLIGPKLNFRKFDKGFIDKGFQNEQSFGILIGYGINYEFHGTKFSPEIKYSIETAKQNKINDSQRCSHTLALAINFF